MLFGGQLALGQQYVPYSNGCTHADFTLFVSDHDSVHTGGDFGKCENAGFVALERFEDSSAGFVDERYMVAVQHAPVAGEMNFDYSALVF